MGVHDLWQVVSDVKKKTHLGELSGQVIAVDLSGWIVESQLANHGQTTKNPHLRNLFYRCSKLLSYGIKLVFVLEGRAPQVKGDTLSQRQKNRFGDAEIQQPRRDRSQLQSLSKECQKLLDILGLPYVQSPGEAECTCAFLNKNNMVNGCLTRDGDAFLYGATVIYTGLDINDKDPHVWTYKMSDIESRLHLNREKLIALALLAGCDYYKGVPGVGVEKAQKLFAHLGDVNMIDRFRSWSKDPTYAAREKEIDCKIKKVSHCSKCQHPGRVLLLRWRN